MLFHALIPARSGSKGIPHKNIKLIGGKPLLAHSIEIALACPNISKVVVTTDSPEYALVAKTWGAEVPFLRPSEISGDLSTDFEFFQHYLQWCCDNGAEYPDAIIHLRPTFPNRRLNDLKKCIDLFTEKWNDYDSLRSVIVSPKSPYKMYKIIDNELIPLYHSVNGIKEPYNVGRQMLPETYLHNGCIDIVKSSVITNLQSVSGTRILPFLMSNEDDGDIDYLNDFIKEETLRRTAPHSFHSGFAVVS